MKIDTLVFDFNGTIINDVDLCLDILNKMLTSCNHKTVTKEEYLHMFTFPIIDYYVKAGFDLGPNGKDSFEKLAVVFDQSYRSRFNEIKLFNDVVPTLKKYKENKRLILLSATKQINLEHQVDKLNLTSFFDSVIGINDIYASSKLEQAKIYFSSHMFDPSTTLFIGDSLHDNDVGEELHSHTALIYRGHQAKDVLQKGHQEFLLPDLSSLDSIIDS